jgi:glycosyltransferase involved in cell wall biosynthesis
VTGGRPRVLVVAWWYPTVEAPTLGVFVRDHARAAARDHEVVVVALEAAHEFRRGRFAVQDVAEDGLRTVRVRHGPGPQSYGPGLAMAMSRFRRSAFRPSVVHAHVYMAAVLAAVPARAWRAPIVLSEHYSGFQLGTLGHRERLAARLGLRAAAIVCPPSDALRRALAPYAPGARFRTVPNPVDTTCFRPPWQRTPRGRLLFVGNLEEVKGVPELLDAFGRVRRAHPGVKLELIGGGSRRSDYEALAARLGLADAVSFRGVVERNEVARSMRQAAALIAPSRTETFGTAVAEALACGLPVIGTHVGALPEMVHGSAGRLVRPSDPSALADAIDDVLRGAVSFDHAAVAAEARRRFSTGAVADAWRDVYAEAMAMASSRRGT